jgi:hypothetical protein
MHSTEVGTAATTPFRHRLGTPSRISSTCTAVRLLDGMVPGIVSCHVDTCPGSCATPVRPTVGPRCSPTTGIGNRRHPPAPSPITGPAGP